MLLIGSMGRRLSERQLQLFFLLGSLVVRYRPDGSLTLADVDVANAASAMAGTLEAAASGVIAQLPGSSAMSEGLRREFDGMLAELGKGGGAGFGREAAEVLRGIERGARHEDAGIGDGMRDYLDLLKRLLPPPPEAKAEQATPAGIILP